MEKKLIDVCRIQYGYAFDSAKFSDSQGVPLIRIRDVVRGYSETYTTEKASDEYIINDGDMLIGMDGEFNIAHWKGGKAYLNQRVCRLIPSYEVDALYLFYFMPKALKAIEDKTPFVTVKHLSAKELNKVIVPIPEIEQQKRIASSLQKVDKLIALRKEQLAKLDQLVKSRFIELFGNPLDGTAKYSLHQVGEVAEAVDPQPSHRTPPIEEGGIPYVSIKDCNHKTGEIDFDGARKVSRTVLAEHLSRYTLQDGDFVIGKIGTIGNPVFVPARSDYTLSANVVLVQPNSELVSPWFLKYSFESEFVEQQFAEAKNSTSQAAFGIQKVRSIEIMNPDLDTQRRFESFVKQTDKSKLAIQQSLDKLELLKKSLMQEYFG